ncbi:adenosylhomocysteinase [Leifsonia shinshuensis]|uniref:Adenosylhomocysteinase n=1 Tax=Leifsonia shinshuensis TaxID=150026 RepID=A0A853D149_9MICO|nr:adenosylhomocysteinase [Leifsonia shinshuensis]
MFEVASRSHRQWAAAVTLGFAETTNLSISGRRFDVRGSGQDAAALAALLEAIGARRTTGGETPDYLFCFDAGAAPLSGRELAERASGRDRPLVIADATPDGSAVDGSVSLGRPLRAGVWATSVPDAVLVRLDATRHAPDESPAADRIAWARRFMPAAERVAGRLATEDAVRGLRIGVSMVLEPKTAVLALLLQAAGADVSVFSHPDETDDAVAAALAEAGLRVFARADAGPDEHLALATAFLARRPEILVDDGSHVIRLAHEAAPDVLETMIGAAEETTSGLRPLRAMAAEGRLRIPVVAVNDARSKTLFDNRYGTGQSCLFTILGLTGLDLDGRTVAVAGYGHVGEGLARHARAFGASVVIAEPDPVRALAAAFDGFRVAPLLDAVGSADLVVSATGVRDTIGLPVLRACAPSAVVAVAGGVPQEVAVDDALAAGAVRESLGRKRERLVFPDGHGVELLDDGGCINVTAGEGNPIEIMDLSFAVQLSAIEHLVATAGALAPGVHPLPAQADDAVAAAALAAAGVRIDARQPAPPAAELWPRFGGTA